MSESELALATTLQKEGVLEDAIAHAQERGLSLLDFIKDCCRGTLLRVDPSMHRSGTTITTEEVWEAMLKESDEAWSARMSQAYREGRIGDMSGEELRELCRD